MGNCMITKKLKGEHVLVQLDEFQSKSSQPFQGWRKKAQQMWKWGTIIANGRYDRLPECLVLFFERNQVKNSFLG